MRRAALRHRRNGAAQALPPPRSRTFWQSDLPRPSKSGSEEAGRPPLLQHRLTAAAEAGLHLTPIQPVLSPPPSRSHPLRAAGRRRPTRRRRRPIPRHCHRPPPPRVAAGPRTQHSPASGRPCLPALPQRMRAGGDRAGPFRRPAHLSPPGLRHHPSHSVRPRPTSRQCPLPTSKRSKNGDRSLWRGRPALVILNPPLPPHQHRPANRHPPALGGAARPGRTAPPAVQAWQRREHPAVGASVTGRARRPNRR